MQQRAFEKVLISSSELLSISKEYKAGSSTERGNFIASPSRPLYTREIALGKFEYQFNGQVRRREGVERTGETDETKEAEGHVNRGGWLWGNKKNERIKAVG